MKKIFFLSLTLLTGIQGFSQYAANWKSLDTRPTPPWFEDAKFGIFIHWGVYSVPAWATKSNADGFGSGYAEWYWQRLMAPNLKIHKEFTDFHQKNYGTKAYQEFAQDFKAELFNPTDWAKTFKNSGAKYVVLTSKHHEGFTMWPTALSWNWNAGDIGPRRDLAGDLSAAVKAENLKMGFYYSLYEWFNPTYKSNVNAYVQERMLPQMKELVTNYKPDILWTDGEWEQSAATWRSEEFLSWLFSESVVKNDIVVNDRWGNDTKGKHGSFLTSEYGKGGSEFSDTSQGFARPWEECRGMGESFGYNRNENLSDYRTGSELIHQLIDIVSKGGNLLLNIGPTADGRIPVIMQERLHEIGQWLSINGEGIYETRRVNLPVQKDVFFTRKGKDLYVILTKWQDKIMLPVSTNPQQVSMLGIQTPLKFKRTGAQLEITAPTLSPATTPCQHAWVWKVSGVL